MSLRWELKYAFSSSRTFHRKSHFFRDHTLMHEGIFFFFRIDCILMPLNLDFFFQPSSVVLYGISRKPGKSGYFIGLNMKSYNPEHLYIIHPEAEEVHGIPCKKRFEDLPNDIREHIELAIVSVPVPFVTQAVLDCIKHGVKGINYWFW